MVEDSRTKKIIAISVITFVLFISLMSYADSYDFDYIENSEFVRATEFSLSFDLPPGTYYLIFDTKGLLEDQIQGGEPAFITGNIQYLLRQNQNVHSNASFTIDMDSSETARYEFIVPNFDIITVITWTATDSSSGVIMVEKNLKGLDRVSFIIGIATFSFFVFFISIFYLAYHRWTIRKELIERKARRVHHAEAMNLEWYTSGNVSDETLDIIYAKKDPDDEILGIFVYGTNKVLILSKLYIKVLDRGFFRSSYNFNQVTYSGLTEIQRQSNCIFILRNNNMKSKFCLQSEKARDKAIEIMLQTSDLENVTFLPDRELVKQKEREERRQRKIEKRRQQWEVRQRRKRHSRSIENKRIKKQQSPSPTVCLGCGSNNSEDSNFCLICGVSLKRYG